MNRHIKKIFVVFKTHFDIGYTDLAGNLVKWYSENMIKEAVKVCEATSNNPISKRYVWTIPSWPLKKTIEGITEKELQDTVESLIADRQLIWHGLPFTTHTEFCGMEDFIRGLYIARELSKKYGFWASDAKMTDVPGHTWILPSILAKVGIKFIHLGSNMCSASPEVPRIFYWEGPDGSRVLAFYSKGDYGTDLIPPVDWDYPYWLAMLNTSDNQGAQDKNFLERMFERAKNEIPEAKISIGSLEDFGNALIEGGFDIPVLKGDIADTWIRGVGSAPEGVSKIRSQRPLVSALESALTINFINKLFNNLDDVVVNKKTIAECYEKMLLFGEHTWGMDAKSTILPERCYGDSWSEYKFWENGVFDRQIFNDLKCNESGFIKIQQSWQEQMDYLLETDKNIEAVKSRVLPVLAESVDFDGERLITASNFGWEAEIPANVEGILPENTIYLIDPLSGEKNPIYINYLGERTVKIKTPAIGYRTYRVIADIEAISNVDKKTAIAFINESFGILENRYFKIEIDKDTGCIKKLWQKSCGRNWVNEQSEYGFGQYVYDIYGSDELNQYLHDYCKILRDWAVNDFGKAGYPKEQQHERYKPDTFEMEAENGFNWSKITLIACIQDKSTVKFGNAKKIEFIITVYEDNEYIDIQYNIVEKNDTPFIESGHFAFPLNISNPQYSINKLGTVINPETEVLPGCNKDLYCLEKWLDIYDGNQGMAIIPLDMPLFSFSKPGVLKFEKDFKINEPTVLFQAFNNSWGTNFPQWIKGDLSFRYRLVPHEGNWCDAKIPQIAEESNTKYVCAYARRRGREAKLPALFNILANDLDGFTVLSFKISEDLSGFILRINDIIGRERETSLHFNLTVSSAWYCDLIERLKKQVDVTVKNGHSQICFITEPFEIHTFYILFKKICDSKYLLDSFRPK